MTDIEADIASLTAQRPANPPSNPLAKIADAAEAATTASHAETVAARTSAAMSDFYSSALHTLANVKLQIENLERQLELRRQDALNEVEQFTKATAEIFNIAATLSRAVAKVERHVAPVTPDGGR